MVGRREGGVESKETENLGLLCEACTRIKVMLIFRAISELTFVVN